MNEIVGTTSPTYFPMGEQAVVAQFEEVLSLSVSRHVQSFARSIEQNEIPGVNNLIPAFNNLTICYDATVIGYEELVNKLQTLEKYISEDVSYRSKTVHIPVVFGGEHGPDLKEISEKTGLKEEEVIKLLHKEPYFVYMIGFIAGYPYCGNIDERLRLNRRTNPRIKVKKGTIQIADQQIGIVTMDAPSGWHIVGWTPMEVFNPYQKPPGLLHAGDYVKYIPIRLDEAECWNEQRQREWDQEWNSLK